MFTVYFFFFCFIEFEKYFTNYRWQRISPFYSSLVNLHRLAPSSIVICCIVYQLLFVWDWITYIEGSQSLKSQKCKSRITVSVPRPNQPPLEKLQKLGQILGKFKSRWKIQWNLPKADTYGFKNFVCYKRCPPWRDFVHFDKKSGK